MGILGELKRHWISELLGTDFMEFHVPDLRCQGMARVKGEKLDILAIISEEPGRGHFRQLIEGCKREYREIRVLQIMEPIVAKALKRYGFRKCYVADTNGERSMAMRWRALTPSTAPIPASQGDA